MSPADDAIHRILGSLRERAKELECLYRVDAHLAAGHASRADALGGIAKDLPSGWQHPSVCFARVVLEGEVHGPGGHEPTPWVQRAGIVVQGEEIGAVEVYYREALPPADEGPFLKEERRLIDTIAERISHYLLQHRLQAALHEWQGRGADEPAGAPSEWRLILGFLALTDRQLLSRLSRRMLNHLGRNGNADAQRLLHSLAPSRPTVREAAAEDNQPTAVQRLVDPEALAEEAFRLGAAHLGQDEMVRQVQAWIKDGKALYLLQCRSQSHAEDQAAAPLPTDIDPARIVFTAERHVSNGRVPDLTHVVYVDPASYKALPELAQLRDVGRAVGRLNKLLPRRRFLLMGPGRWGSRGDIHLGVGVTYSDINNTALLVEVARREGQYVPDVSFGTHFFQDLVEASIRYLPLYPDEPGVLFHEQFLLTSENRLGALLPEFAHLSGTLRVIDVPAVTGGLVLRVLMNGDQDRALAYLATPAD